MSEIEKPKEDGKMAKPETMAFRTKLIQKKRKKRRAVVE